VDINGGTIDGATIGGSSAGAGTFTNLTSTGTTALQNVSTTNSALNISSSASDGSATIDASGNLLVGTTSYNSAVDGSALAADGFAYHTRDNNRVQVLNRLTSDGEILDFRKDGTTVGSIGTYDGGSYIGSSGGGADAYLMFNNSAIYPSTSSGAARDNAIKLGYSGSRFSDLYLSGGVYLGGTGAANYLDDYEEGTFTPGFGAVTVTYNSQSGKYIKIGNLIHVEGILDVATLNTVDSSFNGITLPFSAGSSKPTSIVVSSDLGVSQLSNKTGLVAYIELSTIRFGTSDTTVFRYNSSGAWNSSGTFYFAGSYYID